MECRERDSSDTDNDLLLLRPQTRSRVRDLYTKDLGPVMTSYFSTAPATYTKQYVPLEDDCSVAATDVVRDLGRVAFVVHQEKVYFPDVVDQKLLQAVGKKVTGLKICQ